MYFVSYFRCVYCDFVLNLLQRRYKDIIPTSQMCLFLDFNVSRGNRQINKYENRFKEGLNSL